MKYRLLLVSPILFLACNADHSLGSLDLVPDAGADTTTTSKTPPADALTPTTGPTTSDTQNPVTAGEAESWTGYVENYTFGSGSDRIKLVFSSDTSGQITGTVTFGNGIAPPPATDPNVGYPTGMVLPEVPTLPAYYLEGIPFTIKSGSLQSNRLRLSIDPVELWAGWCALQPPPIDGSDTCAPNWGGTANADHTVCVLSGPSGESLTINCAKWNLCFMSRVCKCSAAGCVVNYEESGYKTSFDLTLANGTASGSMKSHIFSGNNVHFTKD